MLMNKVSLHTSPDVNLREGDVELLVIVLTSIETRADCLVRLDHSIGEL